MNSYATLLRIVEEDELLCDEDKLVRGTEENVLSKSVSPSSSASASSRRTNSSKMLRIAGEDELLRNAEEVILSVE